MFPPFFFYRGMILLQASDFGLPQRRTRLFILAINTARASAELTISPSQVLDTAVKVYLPLFKTEPPSVDACSIVGLDLNYRIRDSMTVSIFHSTLKFPGIELLNLDSRL